MLLDMNKIETIEELFSGSISLSTISFSELFNIEKYTSMVGMFRNCKSLKYADLSNQIAKDYIFDIDKFTSFEGNTGPYILYTLVRIKSILNKYFENNKLEERKILEPSDKTEKDLLITISKFNQALEEGYFDNAPSRICAYLYELSDKFNYFYQKVKILQGDGEKLASNISMLMLIKEIFECGIDLLGFKAPEKM